MIGFIKVLMIAIDSIILTFLEDIDFVKEEMKRRT